MILLYLLHQKILASSDELELPDDDPHTLIDFEGFEYLITQSRCVYRNTFIWEKSPPFMVLLVHSTPKNVERRQVIRDKWAYFNSKQKIQVYFLLGTTESPKVQEQVDGENVVYSDIIQGNFIDSEQSKTYKHVMGLKWFTHYCVDAKYLVKIDDDVLINIPFVYNYLLDRVAQSDFMMGEYIPQEAVPRYGEMAVIKEEYSEDFFPYHAKVSAVIYSADVAIALNYISRKVPYLWREDVFVTGVLRHKLRVNIVDMKDYIWRSSQMNSTKKDSFKFMFSEPIDDDADREKLWKNIQ